MFCFVSWLFLGGPFGLVWVGLGRFRLFGGGPFGLVWVIGCLVGGSVLG